jgi:hypothetical protein
MDRQELLNKKITVELPLVSAVSLSKLVRMAEQAGVQLGSTVLVAFAQVALDAGMAIQQVVYDPEISDQEIADASMYMLRKRSKKQLREVLESIEKQDDDPPAAGPAIDSGIENLFKRGEA